MRAFDKIEVSFEWPDFIGDPLDYSSHDVRVAVSAPGGKTASSPAFFDGGTTWWSTLAGQPLKTETVRADKNGLSLEVPSIARDVAVWAQKIG